MGWMRWLDEKVLKPIFVGGQQRRYAGAHEQEDDYEFGELTPTAASNSQRTGANDSLLLTHSVAVSASDHGENVPLSKKLGLFDSLEDVQPHSPPADKAKTSGDDLRIATNDASSSTNSGWDPWSDGASKPRE